MTLPEKIAMVKALCPDFPKLNITDSGVESYLSAAEDAIMNRLYPLTRTAGATMPPIYDMLECKLAVRYILRAGAEGETVHAENGITRHYDSTDDIDLLNVVVPYAEVR